MLFLGQHRSTDFPPWPLLRPLTMPVRLGRRHCPPSVREGESRVLCIVQDLYATEKCNRARENKGDGECFRQRRRRRAFRGEGGGTRVRVLLYTGASSCCTPTHTWVGIGTSGQHTCSPSQIRTHTLKKYAPFTGGEQCVL